ncbi:plasmodesmata-located protein 1-like [Argentina anserina]|uniref:plasmodesmata-located protein 1-like n=1 Tax=Argentina anserina TaxID=57926 RepID=UPI00217678EE|nr:plasmodesmata-located protein 1-like [Potentilla anserina]
MDFPTNQALSFCSTLLFFISFASFSSVTTAVDYTSLVYKGCANQKFQDSTGAYTQNLKTLFSSLVSSAQQQKTFFTTTSGDSPNAIMGLYQCRGDLSPADCSTCVSKLPSLTQKLCGEAIAARVHLSGCYLRYEISGLKQVSGTQLLYKICKSSKAGGSGEFEEKRDSAFEKLESGIKSTTFYTGSYESVYVLGQCEGDLSNSDCGDCIKSASEKANTECGDSASGQIYQHKCYINYSYYANGVPNLTSSSGTVRSSHHTTQKTVAIVVGGVAAVGFVFVCLMFIKSLIKKRGAKYGDYY